VSTETGESWVAAREGQERWLHHLPRTRVVRDRRAWLVDLCRGQSVAHIGFADLGCERTNASDERWLHARVASSASRVVGLDVSATSVELARSRGFEAYEVDCTQIAAVESLGIHNFDIVLAGEVIEHLDNSGGFLRAMHSLACADGRLVITTPNARRLMDTFTAALGREIVHPDHTTIYSVRTLTALLARHEWDVVLTTTYANELEGRPRNLREAGLRSVGLFQKTLVRVAPYVADGLIVVAKPSRRS